MKICPDCYATNRSYLSYCQKCSGSLMNRVETLYADVRLKKKINRRRPTFSLYFLT
jgi:ribosomal protein L40E